jgi:xylose dehydrogenase (NAD/NADP)
MDDAGRVGWGVLGVAGVTQRRFLPALQKARNGYLAAIGSRSPDRAKALVEAIGEGHAVRSYDDVLKHPAVDAVYVPLPNALHREWTLKSLAAGKHVLCEKPLALSVAAVNDLAKAAAAADRVVMEGFMYRFHPQYEPAVWQPLLEQLGAIRFANVRLSYPFNRPGDIRENPALGGGALWDIGCYCLDVLGWQLGEVAEVQATGDLVRDCNWTTSALLRFASGTLATCWWSFAGPISQRLTLVGQHGVLDLDGPFCADGPVGARLEVDGKARTIGLPADDCFGREIEHFGDVIHGTASAAIPLSDSARWIRLATTIDDQVRAATRARAFA